MIHLLQRIVENSRCVEIVDEDQPSPFCPTK